MKHATLRADALLLLAAVIWGSGFVAQRIGMDHVGPMTYTAARMALGTLTLLPIVLIRNRRPKTQPVFPARLTARLQLAAGVLVGAVLFVGVSLQQIGLVHTTAGKAGFITGLYVVFVPVLGLFLRHRIGAGAWLGVALAAVGLYFLSVSTTLQINRGDCFVLACAVVWAVHLQLVGWLSPQIDSLRLATLQFAVAALLATMAAPLFEQVTVSSIVAARWAILYGGIFPVALAFTLQIVAQRDAPPTHAAILLSLEAVFAALIGWWILDETFSLREFLGCLLMMAGVLTSQLCGTRRPA